MDEQCITRPLTIEQRNQINQVMATWPNTAGCNQVRTYFSNAMNAGHVSTYATNNNEYGDSHWNHGEMNYDTRAGEATTHLWTENFNYAYPSDLSDTLLHEAGHVLSDSVDEGIAAGAFHSCNTL